MSRYALRLATPLLALLASSVATAQSAVTTLGVDGRTNANPSVAVNGTFVAVAWSAATVSSMDIYLATSRDGGKTFAAPVRVNGIDGDARVNGEMPPRVVLVPKPGATPQIVVVWTAKHGANYAILSSRSTDGGRTFSSAVDVPGSAADGNRGWESVTADDAGHVYALWLDHRALAADMAHAHDMAAKNPTSGPAPKPDPTERAGLSHLYFSSLDGKRATVITNSVCYCCKTSLVSAGNNIYAVWRHVYPGSMRDMAFSMSTDRGRTFSSPVRVSEDKWQIDGCPDNGPSLAVDSKKRVHIAWPTAADSKDPKALAVFYATSADGKAFSARAKVPSQGPAQHPQIVVGRDGVPIVAWDETVDGTRRLGFARVSVGADGKATFTTIPSPDAGPGQWYPSLAATGTGAIAAWVRQRESGSAIAVSSLR